MALLSLLIMTALSTSLTEGTCVWEPAHACDGTTLGDLDLDQAACIEACRDEGTCNCVTWRPGFADSCRLEIGNPTPRTGALSAYSAVSLVNCPACARVSGAGPANGNYSPSSNWTFNNESVWISEDTTYIWKYNGATYDLCEDTTCFGASGRTGHVDNMLDSGAIFTWEQYPDANLCTECPRGAFESHEALPSPSIDGSGSGISDDGEFTLRVLVPSHYSNPTLTLLDEDDNEVTTLVFSESAAQEGCSTVYSITHDFQELVNDPLNVFTLIDRTADVWFHGTVKVSVVVDQQEQEFGIQLSNNNREGSFELDFHVVIPKTIDTSELDFAVDSPTGYALYAADFEVRFDCTGCVVPTGEEYVSFVNAFIADFYANGVNSDASIIVTNMEAGSLRVSLQIRGATRDAVSEIVTLVNSLTISDFIQARAANIALDSTGTILQQSNVYPITAIYGASATLRQAETIVDPVSPTGRVRLTLLTSVSPGYKLDLPAFNGPHTLSVVEAAAEGSSTGCGISAPGNTNRCEQFWSLEINSDDCNTGGSFLTEFSFACNRDGGQCPDLANQQLSVSFDLPENVGDCSVQTEQDLTLTATLVSFDDAGRTPADFSDQFFFFNTIFLRAEVQTLNEVIAATTFAKLTLRYDDNTEVVLYDTSANPQLHPDVQEWNLANSISGNPQLSDVDFLLGENLFSQAQDTVESYTIFGTLAVDYTADNGVQDRRLLDVEVTTVDAKARLSIGNPTTKGVDVSGIEMESEGDDNAAGAILNSGFAFSIVVASLALS